MYLGIDIGTSAVKVVLVDDNQSVVDQSQAALTVSRLHPLWSEQDPQDWWIATNAAVLGLNSALRAQIRAIGLSGQMHGATCLNAKGEVIRPAILWNDGRSHAVCKAMMDESPELTAITGNLAMPGFTAPKLAWMQEHETKFFNQIDTILLPKDYVRWKMSGDFASDMSDSAGTLWLDVAARDWSDEMLSLTGLSRHHMPTLFEGSEATGQLAPNIARAWNMASVPIAAGSSDNAAGAIGSGAVTPGKGFISLGTSGVIFISDDHFRPNTDAAVHTFCHALPNLWHRMSVILSAASAVDFVARVTGYDRPATLFAATAEAAKPGATLTFLPYLSGERTPHNDPKAAGAFFGLTHEDSPLSMAQAALEGVAFALADGFDVLNANADVSRLALIGGGSRSDWWAKIIASTLNIPLDIQKASTIGPAFGAARLARLCLGEDAISHICKPPPISQVIEPDPDLHAHYAGRRETFSHLYQATQELNR